MLSHLRIRNLALVEDLSIEFTPGFNAITGETGAGKSILIGALNLLLGERADRTLLRAGADACTVEAVIDTGNIRAPLPAFLDENGLEPGEPGQLLLKRTFSATGANRQFINGSPASLNTLAMLGTWLVDIHGPHDHQSLFQPARQLDLLDGYAGVRELRDRFERVFDERTRLLDERAALVQEEGAYARELELLRHQVQEITSARLGPGDDEDLEAEHARARNAARLLESAQAALGILSESEESLTTSAARLGRVLHDMARLDPAAASMAERQAALVELIHDLQVDVTAYADKVDLDPGRLVQLEDRLNLVQGLRRKYGSRVADILAFGEAAAAKLNRLESRDAEIERITRELAEAEERLRAVGRELTSARRAVLPRLAKVVSAQLRDLGFLRSGFSVQMDRAEQPSRSGFDVVEFQFAPNPGEPPRSLRAIASSGELARVMLALKTVLASQDDVPIVVFDEVDANIGGETAHTVGAKMRDIGRRRQVLCITHLAQVAASGDSHFVVSKAAREGRTVSRVARVDGTERRQELARMLGGGAAAEKHAEALLRGRT